MSSEFEDFTKALEQASRTTIDSEPLPGFNSIAVLGGGPEACMLAALSLAQNHSVTLFTAYGSELNALRSAGGITLRGDGPTGTYQIDQQSTPSIHTTAELDSAVASADLIFLTGPVHKHRTYAMVLADHLHDGQTLVVMPSRSFAALETRWLLKSGGCNADITIVEVQNLPYWIRLNGNVLVLSACNQTVAASLPSTHRNHVKQLHPILPNIQPVPTVAHSSFADGSGAVESVALMMGLSRAVQSDKYHLPGAEPLAEHENMQGLIDTERGQRLVHQVMNERRDVARRYGIRNLPDDKNWVDVYVSSSKGDSIRPVPSEQQSLSMLRSAVTGSLIPLQSAGKLSGTPTPITDALVTLAGVLLGQDLTAIGRRLENMGASAQTSDEARRWMENEVRGE